MTCPWRWLGRLYIFNLYLGPFRLYYWSRGNTTTTIHFWLWFHLKNSHSVKIIEKDVFITVSLSTKNVDVFIHDAACVTISGFRNVTRLLALHPP